MRKNDFFSKKLIKKQLRQRGTFKPGKPAKVWEKTALVHENHEFPNSSAQVKFQIENYGNNRQ